MKVNLDQLAQLASQQPKFTKLFIGLSQIDKFIKDVVRDTIENQATNPASYYVKTELDNDQYILSLFNTERHETKTAQWMINVLLEHCKNKTIEFQVQAAVCRIIKQFN